MTPVPRLRPMSCARAIVLASALGLLALGAPPAAAWATEPELFGIKSFEAGTCSPVNRRSEETEGKEPESREAEATTQCTYSVLESLLAEHKPTRAYTQADGFPKYGLTSFEFNNVEPESKKYQVFGTVKALRVDLPTGLSVDPLAAPRCPLATFTEDKEGEKCPENTIVGENFVTIVGNEASSPLTVALKIYNLVPANGLPLEVGIYNPIGPELDFLEGHISWHSESGPGAPTGIATGDDHEYFVISGLPDEIHLGEGSPIRIKRIQQAFFGNAVGSGFLRLPSRCAPSSATTHVRAESYSHAEDTHLPVGMGNEVAEATTVPPLTVEGCGAPPFNPSLAVTSRTNTSDAPSGVTVGVSVPHNEKASELDTSDLEDATVTLPEGMTINPSAAAGIEACTPQEIGIEADGERTGNEVSCPEGSEIGTAELDTPDLPEGALKGAVYLGEPSSGGITGPPYTIYVTAEDVKQYGVAIRLKGTVTPNALTGRLTTTFEDAPQLPFSSLTLHFRGGPLAPIANPLECGATASSASFVPYTGTPVSLAPEIAPFAVEGCGGAQPPFAAPGLTQSATASPAQAGASSTFSVSIGRAQGQQYISQMDTALPPGVIGLIPLVTPCAEAAANAGACSTASRIGQVAVQVGSGGAPYTFDGQVYLTEAYGGAPYGLSIVVPATVGPFNLGNVVTRAKVAINPTTAQVEVSASLPTIVGGIPIRIRGFTLDIDRSGFERNPTSCNALATVSTLSGTSSLPPAAGGSATLASAFQAEDCSALPFKPSFRAATSSRTSREDGAGLTVSIEQPGGEANIASVTSTLPIELPSRNATLARACPEARADANILTCPAASLVGHATVVTPALPGKMTGPAYIVSHGGEAFPDLDLVLEDRGVRILLVGHTAIRSGITTTTFASNPDVPISSFTLTLPTGPHSLLSANGSLCKRPLVMPTTLVAQSGRRIVQRTRLAVGGCLPIVRRATRARYALVTVRAPAAGRIAMRGFGLELTVRRVGRARRITLRVPLSRAGLNALSARHRFRTRVRVGFVPRRRGGAAFVSSAALEFR
jgi:hypothetical protein